MKLSVSDADQKLDKVLVYDLWARLYLPGTFLEAFEGGSYLKQGSRLAIFMVIIEDRGPSNARLLLVLVLFSPATENTL